MGKPYDPNLVQAAAIAGIDQNWHANLYKQLQARLRIVDEQQFIQSIGIGNLPAGLTWDLVGRIVYYRGEGILFYMDELDKFEFLPFRQNGSGDKRNALDEYGRYTMLSPIQFMGGAEAEGEGKKSKETEWIPGLIKYPVYDIPIEPLEWNKIKDACVVLRANTQQISQKVMKPVEMSNAIIGLEAMMLPFLQTSLLNSCGVTGLRVNNVDEAAQADMLSQSMLGGALNSRPKIPIIGNLDFQELNGSTGGNAGDFLLSMQAIDNFRIGYGMGLKSGNLFQKNAHMLQSEEDANGGMCQLVLQDRLYQYQQFCDIANDVFGLNLYPYLDPSVDPMTGMMNNMVDGNEFSEQEGQDNVGSESTEPAESE